MDKTKSPHKAILHITLEVFDVLSTGECSGRPLQREELQQYELKPKMVKTINGFDKNDCLTKLKQFLDTLEIK